MDKTFGHYSPEALRVIGITLLALAGLTLAFSILSMVIASDGGWPVWIGGVAIPTAVLGWLTLRAARHGAGRDSNPAGRA